MSRLILHTADWHVGVHTHGHADPHTGVSTRTAEIKRSLEWLVSVARITDLAGILVTGDLVDKRLFNSAEVALIAYALRELSQIAPTAVLLGNHDLEPHQARSSIVEAIASVIGSDIEVHTTAGTTMLGDVPVVMLPYPNRAALDARGIDFNTAADMLGEYTYSQLAEHQQVVVAGHFTTAGARYNAHAQPIIQTGMDFAVPHQLFDDSRIKGVLLGHIHSSQTVGKVSYCGSLIPLTFGEQNDVKGVTVFDADDGTRTVLENPYAPRFVTLDADATMEDEEGSYVRIVSKEPLDDGRRRELTDTAISLGVHLCGIIEPPKRQVRQEAIAVHSAVTHDEVVRAYCSVHGIDGANRFVSLMHEADMKTREGNNGGV